MTFLGFNITRETPAAAPEQGHSATVQGSVTYAHGDQTSLTVSAFYAGILRRANTMGQLPIHYQSYNARTRSYADDLSPRGGRQLNYLLQVRPNPYMNATTLWRMAEVYRILYGNAYIYAQRDINGEIVALYLCSIATYFATSDTYCLTYYTGNLIASRKNVPASSVIHLKNAILSDGLLGISTLTFAARSLNTAATQDALTLDMAAKGGRKKIVIQEKEQATMGLGRVGKNAMTDIARNLQNDLWDGEHDVTYVPNVAAINDISQSMQELQLLDLRKFSLSEAARFLGVPASMLGDTTNTNYRTAEDAMNEFLSSTIAPNIAEIEDELNSKLLTADDFGHRRFHIDDSRIFRLNRTAQAAWNKSRMETGVVSVNELRQEMGLSVIDNGDDHYISTNLAVAGSDKLTE